MRVIRGLFILATILVLMAAAAPVWLIPAVRLRNRLIRRLQRACARAILWWFRVRVRVKDGPPLAAGPALYVANHTGYLDILVMMSIAPGVFISREGIIWWPVIGQMAALGGTLFIDRRDRLGIARVVEKVRRRLESGTGVVLFPEATTSNGDTMLPFKSSLFAAAEERDGRAFPVRPFVIQYRTLGGEPVTVANRDGVFWYGDATLSGHLWQLLRARGIDVDVTVLPEQWMGGGRREFAVGLRERMLREYEPPGRG